jgi:hypothetical protein
MDVPGLQHLGIFAYLDEEIKPRLGKVFLTPNALAI